MNKLTLAANLLFVSTIIIWLLFDYYPIIKTPLRGINHWFPEYTLITLIIYKWKRQHQTRKLWLSFLWIVSWIALAGTFLGATIFQRLATMTVFLSALWLGLVFARLRRSKR